MQEWYLMTPETRPNITGGFENDAFLDYKEDAHMNKRKKHKVYHLYFIIRSLEYDDGTVLMNINYQLNI
mgnify:CR=1 FL=1